MSDIAKIFFNVGALLLMNNIHMGRLSTCDKRIFSYVKKTLIIDPINCFVVTSMKRILFPSAIAFWLTLTLRLDFLL